MENVKQMVGLEVDYVGVSIAYFAASANCAIVHAWLDFRVWVGAQLIKAGEAIQ